MGGGGLYWIAAPMWTDVDGKGWVVSFDGQDRAGEVLVNVLFANLRVVSMCVRARGCVCLGECVCVRFIIKKR